MKFVFIEGATPIDEDERQSLIPRHLQTQDELNAFENLNISQAIPWAHKQKGLLTVSFLKTLHKQMFAHTWKWAGQFRKSQKNIGVDAYRIESELYQLCGDTQYQIQNQSFGPDEIAIRFHHRLVFIHAFVNGNGRHARLACDLLIQNLGNAGFSWGSKTYNHNDLSSLNDMRRAYISALKSADQGDYEQLISFARK
jgi:Fic-DOC domain mobile mystery protein B